MFLRCLLLSGLAQTALGYGLRANLASGTVNEASVKQTGVAQISEVQQLREKAKKLEQELSEDELAIQNGKLEDAVDEQAATMQVSAADKSLVVTAIDTSNSMSDDDVFSKLKERVFSGDSDDPDEEEDEDMGGGGAVGGNVGTRPGALAKKPDEVEFGLFAKTFYGVSVKTNSFVIDLVMTLKWQDPRVVALIPAGLDSMTLSKLESEKSIWLPGMVVTNRDIKKYDLISTAVFIKRTGEVFKVERATAIVKNKYVLNQFPFDRQVLHTKIASHKYMIKDLVLKPAKDGSGVKKGLMAGESYAFVKVEASEYKDKDGALKKSRGVLSITVDHITDKYTQSHLIPGCLLVMISWGVFWFPFVAPFITPRLAMSILTLLNFTYLTIKSSAALPAGAPFNWNDVINRTILTCMFSTVVLNILSEICLHQLKVDDLAKKVNNECKIFLPFMTISSLSMIFSTCGRDNYMSLARCSQLANIWVSGMLLLYFLFTGTRIMAAMSKNRLKEVASK